MSIHCCSRSSIRTINKIRIGGLRREGAGIEGYSCGGGGRGESAEMQVGLYVCVDAA